MLSNSIWASIIFEIIVKEKKTASILDSCLIMPMEVTHLEQSVEVGSLKASLKFLYAPLQSEINCFMCIWF